MTKGQQCQPRSGVQIFQTPNWMLDRLGAYGLKSELVQGLLTERAGEMSAAIRLEVEQAAAAAQRDSWRFGPKLNKHVLFGLHPCTDLEADKAQVASHDMAHSVMRLVCIGPMKAGVLCKQVCCLTVSITTSGACLLKPLPSQHQQTLCICGPI